MKFEIISFDEIIIYFYKTALYLAIEKENIEIIKLLLTRDNIDVNIPYIPNQFYIKFIIISFDLIRNHIV